MLRRAALSSVLCFAVACAAGIGGGDDGAGGGGSGGGGSGGGGGGGDVPDASCPSVNFTATRTTPSIELLVDRSLSMGYKLDPNATASRYVEVTSALDTIVQQLQGDAYFGASTFMNVMTDPATCPRISKTSSRQMYNLTQVTNLFSSQSPTGNTPTAASVTVTAGLFAASPPPADSPPIIVLATDGFPNNCQVVGDPQADTVAAIRDAKSHGIRTFVLGLADVAPAFLQTMANAGAGMPPGKNAPFYTANNAAELASAVQTIIGGVTSCELMISGEVDPQAANQGTVTLNGQMLKLGVEWEIIDGKMIRLIGAACETLKSLTTAHVVATFPCTAVILT